MLKTHKIRLDPNNKQRTLLEKSAGVARFSYNWALSEWNRQYEAWKEDSTLDKPNQYSLRKQLNAVKKEVFPWMLEVSKCCPQEAIINLGKAFDNFFRGNASYPVYHKKGVRDSFKISQAYSGGKPQTFYFSEAKRLHIPKIGKVRTFEKLRFEGKLISLTVSKRADRWFASVVVDTNDENSHVPDKVIDIHDVGIDAGAHAYVTSDAAFHETPRSYRTYQSKLRRQQKSLSRKHEAAKKEGRVLKDCMNYQRQKTKIQNTHYKISNQRENFLHQLTNELVDRYNVIAIEDLDVKGMVKNRHLSKSITDASFGEFRRQLVYKAAQRNVRLVVIDRYYASSKTCSVCGEKTNRLNGLAGLRIRSWKCTRCGTDHDRDINAAINIRNYARIVQPCQSVESS